MVKPIYLHGRSYYHMILLKKSRIMCFPGFSRGQNHRTGHNFYTWSNFAILPFLSMSSYGGAALHF